MEEIDHWASESLLSNTSSKNTGKVVQNCLDSFSLKLPDWILSKMIFPESANITPILAENNIPIEHINGFQKVISLSPDKYEPLWSFREWYFKNGELNGYGIRAYNQCIRIGEFDCGYFLRGIYIRYDGATGNILQITIGDWSGDYARWLALTQEWSKTKIWYFHNGLEIWLVDDTLRWKISKDEYSALKDYLQWFYSPWIWLPAKTLETDQLRNTLKRRAYFDNINQEIEYMQKEWYIDSNTIELYNQLHNNDPLRAKLLLPILLDPRYDTKEKVETQLSGIIWDSQVIKWIEENNILEWYWFWWIIEFYVSKYMTYDFVRWLSKNNPELFRKLYPIFWEKYIANNYPDSLERFQGIWIIPIEASAFFQRTGSWDYYSFLEPRYIWHRAMFANLVEKLPKNQENAYRWIRFCSEEERSNFLSNLNGINEVIANFSLSERIARKFASGGEPKEFWLVLSIYNTLVHHLDWEFMDWEKHAWFEEGTQFKIRRIIFHWEPMEIELEIKENPPLS